MKGRYMQVCFNCGEATSEDEIMDRMERMATIREMLKKAAETKGEVSTTVDEQVRQLFPNQKGISSSSTGLLVDASTVPTGELADAVAADVLAPKN